MKSITNTYIKVDYNHPGAYLHSLGHPSSENHTVYTSTIIYKVVKYHILDIFYTIRCYSLVI